MPFNPLTFSGQLSFFVSGSMRYILLLGFLTSIGCRHRHREVDFDAHLVNGYHLRRTSSELVFVTPNGKVLADDSTLAPKITAINHDNRFIIERRYDLPLPGEQSADINGRGYWIVDTQTQQVFGPLTEEQFAKMKSDLGVKPGLLLTSPYEFDPSR